MKREAMLARLEERRTPWDLVVIGGGATGVGIAIDAAARGYDALLLEQEDFGKGTSSRSTKLIHGGVRYLQQGNIPLVMEALHERGILRENAPHLVEDLRFIVPNYDWWEAPFYGIGLKMYDLLAGRYGFGPSRLLGRGDTVAALPTIREDGLLGGVQYFDGQFDDARLLVHMAQTAATLGAVLVNHCPVVALRRNGEGIVDGVRARDAEGGREVDVPARAVVNAAGPFADAVRRMDDPAARALIAPSQGVHLVLDRRFLPGDTAIMVPHTKDGRVMFALPWHDRTLVGTTDTPVERADLEPRPQPQEIDFILETAALYLRGVPSREDVLCAFAGIRPLVAAGGAGNTAALSREHTIDISPSGLLSIVGGKWTTYRRMASDAVDHAATLARLEERPCGTRKLNIHGWHATPEKFGRLKVYGSDAPAVLDLGREQPGWGAPLHARLPYTPAEVVWAARREMARTLDDVLSRRLRATLLDPAAAIEMAPPVARLLAAELGRDEAWSADQVAAYTRLARGYL